MKKDKELGKFTEKEIYEIPASLRNAIPQKSVLNQVASNIVSRKTQHLYLIGAGSSYHAGLAMTYLFNKFAKIPTFSEYAMEFRYLIKPILTEKDCVIAISQSGETKDTIQSIKLAKEVGCLTISITNYSDSTLSRMCDHHLLLNCGEEKSVLATKTYVAELGVLAGLALEIANKLKRIGSRDYNELWVELLKISDKIHSHLPILHEKIKKYSLYFKFAEFCFILGSGPDYATALEGALKLKEGARIFGQAYSTAEFPHGPITLAEPKTCILAIIPQEKDERRDNLLHLLERIKERKATILGIYEEPGGNEIPKPIDFGIAVPNTHINLQPMIMIIAVQLLTLEISRIKGINCDTPKFLSKISGI